MKQALPKVCLCASVAILCLCGVVETAQEQEVTDWRPVIARLQNQLYQDPGHRQTRQQLAVAYNNYGVFLGNQGQWDLAITQLKEAMRLEATNEQFRTNLSHIYFNQASQAHQAHQLQEARTAVDQAIGLDPHAAQAYALLGQLEYESQHLKEAKAAWDQSLKLDPSQPELAKRLEQVTQELPVESKFERLSQAYFDLRYEEQLEGPVGFDIRGVLLEARRAVGSDFAYWPTHKTIVLIYSAGSFRSLRQETPDWVAGQFDGKIRVPFPSGQLDAKTVKQILFHEYTHAIIFDLTEGKCPTWLNEGLAEYEGRQQQPTRLAELEQAAREHRLIPWTELSDHFSTALPAKDVSLGYQESHSIVAYLIERYGFWRIRRLLKALKEGRPLEEGLVEEFHLKPPRLEEAWREWLPEYFKTSTDRLQ